MNEFYHQLIEEITMIGLITFSVFVLIYSLAININTVIMSIMFIIISAIRARISAKQQIQIYVSGPNQKVSQDVAP